MEPVARSVTRGPRSRLPSGRKPLVVLLLQAAPAVPEWHWLVARCAGDKNVEVHMPASADPEQDRAIGQPATDHGEQHVLSRWIQTPARNSASRKSTKAFGSSASCIMMLDTSTWSRKPCNPSTTRSARGCHPCLRYVPLPMSPGRTLLVLAELVLAEREGFEPPIGLHLCRISSAVHSTTLPPLQAPL